jgi:acyl-CoA thioester hydrolase
MKKRIYYNDTAASGRVYYSNYFTYCEQARTEIFFSKGIFFENPDEGYAIKNLKANFIKAAKLGDIIEIKTKLQNIKNASIQLIQEIFLKNEKIFEMEITLVYLKNSKPSKIPQKHKEILNEFTQ